MLGCLQFWKEQYTAQPQAFWLAPRQLSLKKPQELPDLDQYEPHRDFTDAELLENHGKAANR